MLVFGPGAHRDLENPMSDLRETSVGHPLCEFGPWAGVLSLLLQSGQTPVVPLHQLMVVLQGLIVGTIGQIVVLKLDPTPWCQLSCLVSVRRSVATRGRGNLFSYL